MDPIEQRLQSLEHTVSDMRVDVARVSQQLTAHAAASLTAQTVLNSKLDQLVGQVDPLRERSWKQAGATTVLGILGGFAASALLTILRFWK